MSKQNEMQCRAEEKRIASMARQIEAKLNGLEDFDTLTMKEVKVLLEIANLLACAVLHKDTQVIVHDA